MEKTLVIVTAVIVLGVLPSSIIYSWFSLGGNSSWFPPGCTCSNASVCTACKLFRRDTLSIVNFSPPVRANDTIDNLSPSAMAMADYESAVEQAAHFEYSWRPLPNRRNALMLTTFGDYLRRMSRFYYHVVDAAISHPQLNVTVWGPGFPRYDNNVSIGENMHRVFGCEFFDFAYYHVGNIRVQSRDDFQPCAGNVVILEELEDCFDLDCVRTGDRAGDIIVSLYAFQALELFPMSKPGRPPRMFVHAPHCVLPHLTPPIPHSQKRRDALLIGAAYDNKYPLRARVLGAAAANKTHVIKVLEHPGYEAVKDWDLPAQEYDPSSPLTAPHRQQYKRYTQALQETRVCMFDSSIIRKAIRKYMEAMMAGCVVAADVPFEMEELLRPAMVPLDPGDSPEAVEARVKEALAHPQRLLHQAAAGIRTTLSHFTCQGKVELLLQYVDEYRAGFRGYYFPHGMRLGCHNYGVWKGDLQTNAWCKQGS